MVDSVDTRRRQLLALCAQCERDGRELTRELGVSRRTVDADLKWAKAQFGKAFRSRFDGRHRRLFRYEGELPALLPRPLEYLTSAELVAIVAARGLLRLPVDGAAESRSSPYPGLLDGALHRLLARAGLGAQVSEIAPEAIQVSRFAARPEDPEVLATVVTATVRQQAMRFEYTNRGGESHPVHAMPRRLVLIRGEFHCFMWSSREGDRRARSSSTLSASRSTAIVGAALSPQSTPGPTPATDQSRIPVPPFGGAPEGDDGQPGRIKQYRISRMSRVECTPEPPRGCPVETRCWRIDRELSEAFETTGSTSPEARRRVRLGVSPVAIAHLEHRTWGGDQRWLPASVGLPPGWRRLEFWTTGLAACRHWVLSFGAELRAESPPELVTWLREEAMRVAASLGQPVPAVRRREHGRAGSTEERTRSSRSTTRFAAGTGSERTPRAGGERAAEHSAGRMTRERRTLESNATRGSGSKRRLRS